MATILPFDDQTLFQICAELDQKKCVALPTETVFGLAADAQERHAIDQIFILKGRPRSNPLILHIPFFHEIESYTQPGPWTQSLLPAITQTFWPGPLTLVLPCRPEWTHLANSKGFIAIRCPQHPLWHTLFQTRPRPLVAPSANKTHRLTPIHAQEVYQQFQDIDLLIIDGETYFQIESTILYFNEHKQSLHILRPGALSPEDLRQALPNPHIPILSPIPSSEKQNIETPGSEAKHYQPLIPCRLITPKTPISHLLSVVSNNDLLLLGPQSDVPSLPCQTYQIGTSWKKACLRLYKTLSDAQYQNWRYILFWLPEDQTDPWCHTFSNRILRMTEGLWLT